MKTKEEVEKLKAEWKKDTCWDIEDTEGFEEYREELFVYHQICKEEWVKRNQKNLINERKTRPAFPSLKAAYDNNGNYIGLEEGAPGMAIRDYFAGQVLNGILTRGECTLNDKNLAKFAYSMADAMLEEREKEPTDGQS